MNIDRSERDIVIQFMRSFAIMLVVLQHSIAACASGRNALIIMSVCVSIDVKVFMFISGYLYEGNRERYKRLGTLNFIKKKASKLMIPYLFWAGGLFIAVYVLYHLPIPLFNHIPETFGFSYLSLPQIGMALLTYHNYYIELYWFIYVLFLIFAVSEILGDFVLKRYSAVVIIAISSVILYLTDEAYIILKFANSLIVFTIGRLIMRKGGLLNLAKLKYALIAIVAFFAMFKTPELEDIPIMSQCWDVVKSSFLGCMGIVIITYFSHQMIQIKESKLGHGFLKIGNCSFPIYMMHNPYVVGILGRLLKKINLGGVY